MDTENKGLNLGRQTQKEDATSSEGEHKQEKELRSFVLNLLKCYAGLHGKKQYQPPTNLHLY